jgi:uncharacterized BrkB/YihY/UPF0761 family membrane protein
MKAIIDALNVVYDEKEKRSFVKLNLLSLLFTIVAILSLMVALGGNREPNQSRVKKRRDHIVQ